MGKKISVRDKKMGILKHFIAVLIISMLNFTALAENTAHDIYRFTTEAQQQQFNQLTQELRCLVCQNESIGDSNAALAQDLRREVYKRVINGESNAKIKAYLVDRYGQFILF